ncbi:MAG: hypothetical protein IIA62_08085 [Nitrospinae bacterium]|nr:hypothetical protein [Nitrospinota bacterium]
MPRAIVEPDPVKPEKKDELSETEKKVKSEKEKFRRILREKDLKKHLKGKGAEGGLSPEETLNDEKDDAKMVFHDEDLKYDNQLKQAIELLNGWEIISEVYSFKQEKTAVKVPRF